MSYGERRWTLMCPPRSTDLMATTAISKNDLFYIFFVKERPDGHLHTSSLPPSDWTHILIGRDGNGPFLRLNPKPSSVICLERGPLG